MRDSDESNQELLALAREQGASYQKALDYMVHQQAHDGATLRAGDYLVGYAMEMAEGYYEPQGDKLTYLPSETSSRMNAHLEVTVRDGADGRFIPYLDIQATLIDEQGREVGTKAIPFMWHPWLYHYGENWRVPGSGKYTLRVRIEPPRFRRHDEVNGARYAEPVTVEFKNVRIDVGEK